ncbi:MAG: response regulator [Nannocystis sp.]|nr:response regulator [Nannocystis sp.]MBA3547232.1 response regulator [Nannocystis sp.]
MPSSSLQVLIADDELLARRRLARLLAELPGVTLVGECCSGQELLATLARGEQEVDLVLLDIHMPGLTGLEAGALLPDDGPYIIFITAHEEHALAAFDLGAVDYLLKPIDAVRLGKALLRARRRLGAQASAPAAELVRLPVTTRQGIRLLDPRELSHATFDGELVTLHTRGGALLTDFSLQDLEERLPAGVFERVHRRALINLELLACLDPQGTGGYTARMQDGGLVPISRQAARRLRRRLGLS